MPTEHLKIATIAFLDRSSSGKVLAEGIKEAYSDLFAVNTSAHELSADEAFNKLRTLYKGEKKDTVTKNIAKTFRALCDYADFSVPTKVGSDKLKPKDTETGAKVQVEVSREDKEKIGVKSLQYHINVVLPDTRDQAVYDAIFKSMRDHLG